MTHITGHDRRQALLLPEAVDDYVGAENPVRGHQQIDLAGPDIASITRLLDQRRSG